jgi:AraC-like DNA-binding protein
MGAQLSVDVAAGTSQGLMSSQLREIARTSIERIAARSLWSEDLMALEVGRLLEDLRIASDGKFRSETGVALCLPGKPTQGARATSTRGALAPWQERKIRSFIEARLDEPLLVEDLAKLVTLSTSYFCRAFRASFGLPPHTYIIGRRIERARTLMLTSSESLSQIALACGFVDQTHLCKCFRQATGTSPGAWRRNQATGPCQSKKGGFFLEKCRSPANAI